MERINWTYRVKYEELRSQRRKKYRVYNEKKMKGYTDWPNLAYEMSPKTRY